MIAYPKHRTLTALVLAMIASYGPPANAAAGPEEWVRWGNESAKAARARHFEPRFLTPDPNRVEVEHFIRYTQDWAEIEPLYQAWRASLPDNVDVVLRPVMAKNGAERPETMIYYVARELRQAEAAHRAITNQPRDPTYLALPAATRLTHLLELTGITRDRFETMTDGALKETPADAAARWSWAHHGRALKSARMHRPPTKGPWPTIVVNGSHIATTGRPRDAVRTYRQANWFIREALEAGPSHDGPTNNVEFAAWMKPRSGEIFRNAGTGSGRTPFVFNAWRDEIWQLGSAGGIYRVIPLKRDEKSTYWAWRHDGFTYRQQDKWRRAKEYVSFRAKDGEPQRYAAFLFTDWLAEPTTPPVPMRFKKEDIKVKFHPDGTANATTANGPVAGTWWLQAGNLRLSLDGVEDWWPWQIAARRLKFEVPKRSLVPKR